MKMQKVMMSLLVATVSGIPLVVASSAKTRGAELEDRVEALLKCLKNGIDAERVEAARSLSRIPCWDASPEVRRRLAKKVVLALIACVPDKSPAIRYCVVKALGKLRDNRATLSLSALVSKKTEMRFVRTQAIIALGEIGDARAVDTLIPCLSDTSETVRAGATTALGRIGDKRAILSLGKVLGDSSSTVRRLAVVALGYLRNEATEPNLRKALEDKNASVRKAALNTLENMVADLVVARPKKTSISLWVSKLKHKCPEMRAYATIRLRQSRDKGVVDALITAMNTDEEMAHYAALALGDIVGVRTPKASMSFSKASRYFFAISSGSIPSSSARFIILSSMSVTFCTKTTS